MFVSTAMLHSGAAESHRASEHAHDSANHLSGTSPVAGMFGDFAAAEAFHDAVKSAHAHYVKALQTHQESLSDVGTKADHVGHSFSTMEDNNANALREV
jgi:hypothetical protein